MAHDVLIVDDERLIRELLAKSLQKRGHDVGQAEDGLSALEQIRQGPPDLILLDLMMPRMNGFEVLRTLRGEAALAGIQVIVLTARASQEVLQEAFEAGADDYISKPFHLGEVMSRVEAHLRIARYSRQLERQRRDSQILLDISHRLTSRLDVRAILQDITTTVASVLDTDRCSIVLAEGPMGRVVAASDDAGLTDRAILLENYPEIRRVLETRKPVVSADITADPLFDPVKDQLARLDVHSAALFPMMEDERCFGVLFLRSTRPWQSFGHRETQFGQIVANATAVAVSNAQVFDRIREETHRVDRAREIAEEQLRTVERYQEFFERSADCMIVTDEAGRMVFVNRQAELIVGQERTALHGLPLASLLVPQDQPALQALLVGAARGEVSERMDLTIARNGRILSASAARISDELTLGLTARDVTEERLMASELKAAREKLAESERLALMAEFSGAAAHELNQPLTSIMGYAELLKRALKTDDPNLKAVLTIEQQSSRMADIVRRIGQLTHYATRPYVGAARILDLGVEPEPQG